MWHEDQLVPILRNGQLEDVWWTYGFGPAVDDEGKVAGVLVVCTETTQRVRSTSVLEAQLGRLAEVFHQAPSFLAVLRGPNHVYELVNDAYYQLVGHRELIGLPTFETIPEARGQGFEELLDGVFTSGDLFVGRELPLSLERMVGAPLEQRFIDLIYLPLHDALEGAPGSLPMVPMSRHTCRAERTWSVYWQRANGNAWQQTSHVSGQKVSSRSPPRSLLRHRSRRSQNGQSRMRVT